MAAIRDNFEKNAFAVRYASEILNVHNKGNFIEFPRNGGVQLEIPARVRMKALSSDKTTIRRLKESVTSAIKQFMEGNYQNNCVVSERIGF